MPHDVLRFLQSRNISFIPDAKPSDFSSIRIGNAPALMAFPRSEDEIIDILHFVIQKNKRYRLVGGMTNILMSDNKYDGVIICTRKVANCSFSGELMTAECGVRLSSAIRRAAEYSLGGLEALSGIPGTLGGMVYSNAGAYGSEMSDFLIEAQLYSIKDDRVILLDNRELSLSYRNSILRSGDYCLLSAVLKFQSTDKNNVLEKIRFYKQKRLSSQPIGALSLGSVFKRVDGISAAYYIDNAGLKGYRVGGAQVSEKHAGFIINLGGATADDFVRLVSHITETVYDKFGIGLVREVEYL